MRGSIIALPSYRFPSYAANAGRIFVCSRADVSAEVATQHQRRCAGLIIALASSHVVESGAAIQRTRRRVVLVDLEKHGPRTEPGEAPQMQIEQWPRIAAAALALRDGDRENFCFARSQPRQDEADERFARHRAMGDDGFFDQQPIDFVLAPATLE